MVDRTARIQLRDVLVAYMAGKIRAFEFDDRITGMRENDDRSVSTIADYLSRFHDDFRDHSISVTPAGWTSLQRIVAFLCSEADLPSAPSAPSWPFRDEEEWHAKKYLLDTMNLPDYVADIHGRPIKPWWNRIPLSVVMALLAGVVLLVIAVLLLTSGTSAE
ncbi:MAG: hypothetical protein ACTHK7_24495 [Aureliella sp.]